MRQLPILCLAIALLGCGETQPNADPAATPKPPEPAKAGQLRAGVAKVEITHKTALPINDPLYVKALVIKNDVATAVIVTVDAVAIGEIGPIGNDYLGKVRVKIQKELGIAPENVIVNASQYTSTAHNTCSTTLV